MEMRIQALLFLFFIFRSCLASHFIYGSINWKLLSGTSTTQRKYELSIEHGFMQNDPIFDSPFDGVDSPVSAGQINFFPMGLDTPSFYTVNVTETARSITSLAFQCVLATATVTFTIPDNFSKSWGFQFVGLNNGSLDLRRSDLQGANANTPFKMSGVLNRQDTHSPLVSAGFCYDDYILNSANTFAIPTISDYNVTYQFPGEDESGLVVAIPFPPLTGQGAFTLGMDTGIATWAPTIGGVYALAVTVEKNCGTVCTNPIPAVGQGPTTDDCCTRVPVEMQLIVSDACGNCPVFTVPFGNGVAPQDRVIQAFRGQTLYLDVCATSSAATMIIETGILPPNSTFDFNDTTSAGNSQCYTLIWPDPSDAIQCFEARFGLTDSQGQYCVIINVTNAPASVKIPTQITLPNLAILTKRPPNTPQYYALPSTEPKQDSLFVQLTHNGSSTANFAGKVQLIANGKVITSASVAGNGSVTLMLPWGINDLGIHQLTVNYTGDKNYATSSKIIHLVFHFFPLHGRFVVPVAKGRVINAEVTYYSPDWQTVNNLPLPTLHGFSGYTTRRPVMKNQFRQILFLPTAKQLTLMKRYKYMGVALLGKKWETNVYQVTQIAILQIPTTATIARTATEKGKVIGVYTPHRPYIR